MAPPIPLPPALPEFAHIRRSWSSELDTPVAHLMPGQYYVTIRDESIFTVLGSCVAACVRDVASGVGGMNHFMLPVDASGGHSAWRDTEGESPARFGDRAMRYLIESILHAGGHRDNLEAKLFGGGKVLDMSMDVGARNIEFAQRYLNTHGVAIAGSDLGGSVARKIYFTPGNGVVRVKQLASGLNVRVFDREHQVSQPAGTTQKAARID